MLILLSVGCVCPRNIILLLSPIGWLSLYRQLSKGGLD